MKCECPDMGDVAEDDRYLYTADELKFANHAPGECKSTIDLRLYDRHGKHLWLCSCCCLLDDIEVDM